MATTDLLGRPLDEVETDALALYEGLKRLLSREELSPCTRRNAGVALAAVWQIVNDLDLEFEQVFEQGV